MALGTGPGRGEPTCYRWRTLSSSRSSSSMRIFCALLTLPRAHQRCSGTSRDELSTTANNVHASSPCSLILYPYTSVRINSPHLTSRSSLAGHCVALYTPNHVAHETERAIYHSPCAVWRTRIARPLLRLVRRKASGPGVSCAV